MKNFSSFFPFRRYIVSFLAAFLITLILLGIMSIVFSVFPPPAWLEGAASFSGYLSAFLAAFICTAGARKNGLVTGIICADIYMLILIFAGMAAFKTVFPFYAALKIFSICSFAGAIGGILGVNLKK